MYSLCCFPFSNLAMELFEKEAMAWDVPQMRCKAPVGAQKGEGRPKRKSDRKTKRSQGEKKASGRALKAAKLTHSQAGPSLAVNKIKEKEERVMGVSGSMARVPIQVREGKCVAKGSEHCAAFHLYTKEGTVCPYLSRPVTPVSH